MKSIRFRVLQKLSLANRKSIRCYLPSNWHVCGAFNWLNYGESEVCETWRGSDDDAFALMMICSSEKRDRWHLKVRDFCGWYQRFGRLCYCSVPQKPSSVFITPKTSTPCRQNKNTDEPRYRSLKSQSIFSSSQTIHFYVNNESWIFRSVKFIKNSKQFIKRESEKQSLLFMFFPLQTL